MQRRRNIPDAEIIRAEIPLIQKIIRDETWYEGERRRCAVDSRDVEVRKRVADIVLKCSDKILEEATRIAKHKLEPDDHQSSAA